MYLILDDIVSFTMTIHGSVKGKLSVLTKKIWERLGHEMHVCLHQCGEST